MRKLTLIATVLTLALNAGKVTVDKKPEWFYDLDNGLKVEFFRVSDVCRYKLEHEKDKDKAIEILLGCIKSEKK
jgi:hypothetical protein